MAKLVFQSIIECKKAGTLVYYKSNEFLVELKVNKPKIKPHKCKGYMPKGCTINHPQNWRCIAKNTNKRRKNICEFISLCKCTKPRQKCHKK